MKAKLLEHELATAMVRRNQCTGNPAVPPDVVRSLTRDQVERQREWASSKATHIAPRTLSEIAYQQQRKKREAEADAWLASVRARKK